MLKLFRTTTFRLALILMALFGTAAAGAIGYIYWQTNVLLSRQLEQTIEAEIQGLAEQYRAGGMLNLAKTVANRSLTPGNSLYLVTNASGQRVAGNLTSISQDLWNSVGRVEFVYDRPGQKGTESRLALASVFRLTGGFRLIVGRDIEDRRVFERVVRSAFFLGLGFMALVGLGGGWVVSRSLLTRIDAVTEISRTIMTGDLSGRVPVYGSGDELDRLSENLNVMLERIEQLMVGMREVSDNIAHDLKTPLNRLRNRAEAALREKGGAKPYREALERTIEEADDLIKTFNGLLSIARLEAGTAGEAKEEIDVGALIQDVVELYEPAAEDKGMSLTANAPKGVYLTADRQLIGQALANLIDNAIKYGSDDDVGGAIHVSAAEIDDVIEITVSDNGPGVLEKDRKRILKRFVRLEESRSRPGSGLGLALVAAVAYSNGGEVRLDDNKPGLSAVLSLPRKTNHNGTVGTQ
ncbi:sensor kinase CusS [bacterium BMS3Bbin10]|nr:sensor kinase CusS [bacterium BMS3Bbin10]